MKPSHANDDAVSTKSRKSIYTEIQTQIDSLMATDISRAGNAGVQLHMQTHNAPAHTTPTPRNTYPRELSCQEPVRVSGNCQGPGASRPVVIGGFSGLPVLANV